MTDISVVRDLFPTRIVLKSNETEKVGLVLGQAARARGAQADLIPDRLPGVGPVTDGVAEPVWVRFANVTDTQIAQLTGPAATPLPLDNGPAA